MNDRLKAAAATTVMCVIGSFGGHWIAGQVGSVVGLVAALVVSSASFYEGGR